MNSQRQTTRRAALGVAAGALATVPAIARINPQPGPTDLASRLIQACPFPWRIEDEAIAASLNFPQAPTGIWGRWTQKFGAGVKVVWLVLMAETNRPATFCDYNTDEPQPIPPPTTMLAADEAEILAELIRSPKRRECGTTAWVAVNLLAYRLAQKELGNASDELRRQRQNEILQERYGFTTEDL